MLGGHAGHLGEIIQCLATGFRSNLHFDKRLGEGRAAHLCLNADSGQRGGEAENLRFGKTDLFTGSSQTQGHFHDGRFSSGIVVAEIDQRCTEVTEQGLIHVHDIGKLRQGGCRLIGDNIGRITEVDHGTGEVEQIIIPDTQLTGNGDNLGNIIRRRGHLCRHALDAVRQLCELFLGCIHGLSHRSERRLIRNGRFNRRRTQRHNGRCYGGGKRPSYGVHGFAGGVAFLAEFLQRFSRSRPQRFGCFQVFIALFDGGMGLLDGSLCIVESRFGIQQSVRCFLDQLRIASLSCSAGLNPGCLIRIGTRIDCILLIDQLILKIGKPCRKPLRAGIHILDTGSGQLEFALYEIQRFTDGGKSTLRLLYGISRFAPPGLGKAQRLIAFSNFCFGVLYSCTGIVQASVGCTECVCSILHGFLQRSMLSGQLLYFLHRCAIFALQGIEILLGGDGSRMGFAEILGIILYLCSGSGHLFLEGLLCDTGFIQPVSIFDLSVAAFTQLVTSSCKRPLVLLNGILL